MRSLAQPVGSCMSHAYDQSELELITSWLSTLLPDMRSAFLSGSVDFFVDHLLRLDATNLAQVVKLIVDTPGPTASNIEAVVSKRSVETLKEVKRVLEKRKYMHEHVYALFDAALLGRNSASSL